MCIYITVIKQQIPPPAYVYNTSRKISDIRRTKSQNFNDSYLVFVVFAQPTEARC